MINKRRLIRNFKKLVRIDSPSLREKKVVAYLRREFKSLGINNHEAGRVRGGETGNLVAFVPGNGMRKPLLMLNAHMDTVTPGKNIKPIEKEGISILTARPY